MLTWRNLPAPRRLLSCLQASAAASERVQLQASLDSAQELLAAGQGAQRRLAQALQQLQGRYAGDFAAAVAAAAAAGRAAELSEAQVTMDGGGGGGGVGVESCRLISLVQQLCARAADCTGWRTAL